MKRSHDHYRTSQRYKYSLPWKSTWMEATWKIYLFLNHDETKKLLTFQIVCSTTQRASRHTRIAKQSVNFVSTKNALDQLQQSIQSRSSINKWMVWYDYGLAGSTDSRLPSRVSSDRGWRLDKHAARTAPACKVHMHMSPVSRDHMGETSQQPSINNPNNSDDDTTPTVQLPAMACRTKFVPTDTVQNSAAVSWTCPLSS